jgi:2-dehydro-3-deoxygluconokinase
VQNPPTIVLLGEAMLELSQSSAGGLRLAYGGDSLNTAIYLARLGYRPHYVSALGLDPYSDDMLTAWQEEGLDTRFVLRHPSRLPGLYAIQTDEKGERQFHYWRELSAARSFFELPGHEDALAFAESADCLYLTGISLSIFDPYCREHLNELACRVKKRGGEVVFDPNYRARGWDAPHDAIRAFERLAPHVTIALPTIDDENRLYGVLSPDAHAARWHAAGVNLVVLKNGPAGATVHKLGEESYAIPVLRPVTPIDTTGAGDSFNGAFLAAHFAGNTIDAAVSAANQLAGLVIKSSGAIIPRADMPDMASV